MSSKAKRRLTFAVFLMFSALGPITILMESKLRVVSWEYVAIQTISSGAMAATIIYLGNKKWYLILVAIFFWGAILTMNSGGFSIVVKDGKLQTVLGPVTKNVVADTDFQVDNLTPAKLDRIYTQRTILGLMAITLIAFGYARFIYVVKEEVKNRARLQTEMDITKKIQQALLPEMPFIHPEYAVFGVTIPASEVGGDYFDVVKLTETKTAVIIADVSGHGVGAGIVSAMTKSALRTELPHECYPDSLLYALNNIIHEISDQKTFVTCAYILIDSESRKMFLATAGHPAIIYKQASSTLLKEYREQNFALGMKKDSVFSYREISYSKGDRILLYTDGIIEAVKGKKEQFGMERLCRLFLDNQVPPQNMCNIIVSDLQSFSKSENFEDDVTVVVLNFV